MKFLIFCIFSSPYNQLVIFDVIVFPLAAFVLFRDFSRKNARLNHTIPNNFLVGWLQIPSKSGFQTGLGSSVSKFNIDCKRYICRKWRLATTDERSSGP